MSEESPFGVFPMPSSQWLLSQASRLGSSRDQDVVGALAWNLTVAFREWQKVLTDLATQAEGAAQVVQTVARSDEQTVAKQSGLNPSPPKKG